MDRPLTPSGQGNLAVSRSLQKVTREEIQAERDAVLSTTSEDIRDMKKFVSDILEQDAICVYGNEEKVKSVNDLFKNLIKLEK
jgi:Zn-dependent M16 (insulinase) family peptidase